MTRPDGGATAGQDVILARAAEFSAEDLMLRALDRLVRRPHRLRRPSQMWEIRFGVYYPYQLGG